MQTRAVIVVLAVLGLGLGNAWLAWSNVSLRRQVASLEAEVARRDQRFEQLGERIRSRLAEAAPRGAPRPAARPGAFADDFVPKEPQGPGREALAADEDLREAAATRREELRQVLLDAVMEVVAAVAADEGWSAETAAAVMAVFEDTADRMGEVRADVLEGATSPAEGRDAVLDLRDEAGVRLSEILGPDETERLRDRMFDRMQAAAERRRAAARR